MKFRKRPVVVECVQFNVGEKSMAEIQAFTNGKAQPHSSGDMIINTLEGKMTASIGDWIIQGVHGEFYPCKPDIFEKTYEKVDEQIQKGEA